MARTRIINENGIFEVTELVIEGPEDIPLLHQWWQENVGAEGFLGDIKCWVARARDTLIEHRLPPDGKSVPSVGSAIVEDAAALVYDMEQIGNLADLDGRSAELVQRAFAAGMACQRMLVRDREPAAICGTRQLAGASKGGRARAGKSKLSKDDTRQLAGRVEERRRTSKISKSAAECRVAEEHGISVSTLRRRFRDFRDE